MVECGQQTSPKAQIQSYNTLRRVNADIRRSFSAA
jgi:hypothetical protein